MSSIKTTEKEGDVSIGRHVGIGGNANVQGNVVVHMNMKVEGWLDAKNIKGSNKGIFTTVEKLREAFPRPHDGWWAIVGKSLPSPIYVGDGGEWVATGESGGNPTLEDTSGALQQAIDDAKNKANEAKKAIEDMVSSLPIAQEAGDSTTSVMSQAAVTKALKNTQATTDDGKSLEDVYQLTLETQTQNAPLEDFNLSDEDGNVILQLADGHIKTKNFDSESAKKGIEKATLTNPQYESDLDITDEDGNVILQLVDGHIKTKNFDSRSYGNEGIAYVGGKVNLKKNTYNVTKIQHLPERGGQGFAAYGGYAVVLRNSGVAGDLGANKGTAQIYRAIKGYNYSFVKHTDLFKLGQYENNHANCGSFGKKMNETDDFPLLYIPTINECKCTVEKIYLDGHSEKIQEISFSNFVDGVTKHSDLQWVTDGEYLYTFGHSKGWGLRGNKFLIARFDLPDTNGDKQLDMNDAHYLYYMEDYGFHNEIGTQGSIVHNGLLILPMGAGGDQKVTEAHLYVWDLNKRYMVCDINLTKDKATKGEPEDVSIIEDDLYMLMANGDIYKFTF